jgi:hypothetical protein
VTAGDDPRWPGEDLPYQGRPPLDELASEDEPVEAARLAAVWLAQTRASRSLREASAEAIGAYEPPEETLTLAATREGLLDAALFARTERGLLDDLEDPLRGEAMDRVMELARDHGGATFASQGGARFVEAANPVVAAAADELDLDEEHRGPLSGVGLRFGAKLKVYGPGLGVGPSSAAYGPPEREVSEGVADLARASGIDVQRCLRQHGTATLLVPEGQEPRTVALLDVLARDPDRIVDEGERP